MSYRISILVDNESWILPYAETLLAHWKEQGHHAVLVRTAEDIIQGDFAFFLGCVRIVDAALLERNQHNLAVHESDLPSGRGFAPVAWQVLEGKQTIPVVLFEAQADADSGAIYFREEIQLIGHELMNEIRVLQAQATLRLCQQFVEAYPEVHPITQQGESSLYARRTPEDSRLDSHKTLAEQFNLLRVVDNERYPAFFDHRGQRYVLRIEKQSPVLSESQK